MREDGKLRQHVVDLLQGGQAHAGLAQALEGLSAVQASERPGRGIHSVWELAEHIRIAQWDILEFTRKPRHRSPDWPEEYWPGEPEPPTATAWKKTCSAILADLAAFVGLVEDQNYDLLAPLPHDAEKTVLREALLLADHNAYHAGQIVTVRKMLNAWH